MAAWEEHPNSIPAGSYVAEYGQKYTFERLERTGNDSGCVWSGVSALSFPVQNPAPQNQAGLLVVELRVEVFAFCAIPRACIAVPWVGIELLVS